MAEEVIDTMFEDALDALRQGNRPKAKDILTRLLTTDQNNSTYWTWMSAAVETTKERIYCLETALKLDPENATAKRGLVLLGGLTPGENIQPFPLNRPRAWEDDLLLAHEKPQERGVGGLMASPITRLAGLAFIGLVILGLAVYAFLNPRTRAAFSPAPTLAAGPSPTFTLTPTSVNATAPVSTAGPSGPTPLAALMGVSYTATPLYINTPRSPISADVYRSARAAYQQGNWDEYIRQMQQIQKSEPQAADIPYYIGEGYRFNGDCRTALNYYNDSLKVDDKFAPGYLGLARARICIDPGADTNQLYDLAIQADPNFAETYLDRANYNLARKDFKTALPDLAQAEKLMPDSALVQLAYARAYLLGAQNAPALKAAQKANSIDETLLPSYYYLGAAYAANAQYAGAIKPLQIYLIYQDQDGSAYALLGQAFAETGDYKSAIEPLQKALKYDPNQVRSYVYLGTASLRIGDLEGADYNFRKAIGYFPNSFDANIGLTETMYKKGTFGSAYLQAETSKSKAKDDTELALTLYWRALSQEGRGDAADAIEDWQALLAMPESTMTAEMRQLAEEHVSALQTATPTPKGGVPTSTTPTPTPKPSGSGTPAKIVTATKTPSPAPTKTP